MASSSGYDVRKVQLLVVGILVVFSVGLLSCVTKADDQSAGVGSSFVHPDQQIGAGSVLSHDDAAQFHRVYSDPVTTRGGFSQQPDARFYSDRFVDGVRPAAYEYNHGVSFLSRSNFAADPRYFPAGYYARNSRDVPGVSDRFYASQFDPSYDSRFSSSLYDRYPDARFQPQYYSDRASFVPEDRWSSAYQQYAADSTLYRPNGFHRVNPSASTQFSYSTPSSPAPPTAATTPDSPEDSPSTAPAPDTSSPPSTPESPEYSEPAPTPPEVPCPHKKKHHHESHHEAPSIESPSPSSESPEMSPDVSAPYSAPAPSESSPGYINAGPPSPPAPSVPYSSGSGSSTYTTASASNDDSTVWTTSEWRARDQLHTAYGSTSPSTPSSGGYNPTPSTTSPAPVESSGPAGNPSSGGYSSPPSPIAPGPLSDSPFAPYGAGPAAPAPAPDTEYDYAPYPAPYSAPSPGGGGCSCDFWGTHVSSWPSFFSLFSTIAEAFGTQAANVYGSITLFEGLMDKRQDAYSQLRRQGSGAILNSYTRPNYAYTHMSVVEQFNSALTSSSAALVQAKKFENANNDYGSGQECED